MVNAIAILILQLLYVPILTLRTTFLVKGQKVQASLVAAMEAITYIISLGIVFSDLKNFLNIIAYVIGYGVGVYVGCKVEEKLAMGYRSTHVNLTSENQKLVSILRENKFGVTVFCGEGINKDSRYRLDVISHRNREKELIDIILKEEPNAFIVSYEPTQFKGGYLSKQMRVPS